MAMHKEEAIGLPKRQMSIALWLAIVLMGIYVPVLMVLETVIGIAIFPLLLVIWMLATNWSFGKIMRHFVWMYGRVWMWVVSPFVRVACTVAKPDQINRPSIYVANHLSLFDIFFLSAMPVFDVVICLRSWPFKMLWYAPFMRFAEYLDVEHLSWEQIVQQINRILSEGHSVLLFPQGHRSRDGRMTRFYSGAFKLAIRFNVPIVPICITGTDQMMPPGRWWMAPADVRLDSLEPVEPEPFKKEMGHIEMRKHVKKLMEDCLARNQQ
jgi:1-acyl-sn-glycerol-3-phosphate acyltransferase